MATANRPQGLGWGAVARTLVGPPQARPSGLRFCAVVYLVSRIPVVLALTLFLVRNPGRNLTWVMLRQDGWWYTRLARDGYTGSLRPPLGPHDFHHRYSGWAFYPGYPLVIRALHDVTRLPYLTSALVTSSVLGLGAVWAVYALADLFGGVPVARSAALLIALWPGSAAFSLPYSEGLFVAAVALGLMFMTRQRWIWAGACGAIAFATRPTGLALLAAMAVVAGVRLVRHRDRRPLVAVAMTAAGGVGFLLYGWARTGDPLVWRHAENLWGQRFDVSQALIRRSLPVLLRPFAALHDPGYRLLLVTTLLELLGLLMLVVMGVALVRTRGWPSPVMAVYACVAVAMIIGYSAVAARPRMVLAVVPGFVWLGGWLPRRVVLPLAAAFTVLLGVITYVWSWQVTP
ncbi:MAG TPA: hypothetical protein VMT69_08240 [Kineosporiaceae bacterium]|nr:hypothetical protein [Kineosporiaceae bacterium]